MLDASPNSSLSYFVDGLSHHAELSLAQCLYPLTVTHASDYVSGSTFKSISLVYGCQSRISMIIGWPLAVKVGALPHEAYLREVTSSGPYIVHLHLSAPILAFALGLLSTSFVATPCPVITAIAVVAICRHSLWSPPQHVAKFPRFVLRTRLGER